MLNIFSGTGNEVDLTANYKIQKGLSLLTFAAWFSPDKGITGGGTAKEDTVSEYYARLQWEFEGYAHHGT